MGKKILITRHVGEVAMGVLESSGFELIVNPDDAAPSREWVLGHLRNPDVVSACIMHSQPSDKVNTEFLDACNPNLKTISTFSVGFDHMDVAGANARGIKVGHTPGVLNDAVATITTMLVLMTMRRVEEGMTMVKEGTWGARPWAPFVMCGPSIGHPNLTISFIGFGRISQTVVDRLLAFTSKSHPPTITYSSSRERPNQKEIDAEFTKRYGVTVKRVEKDECARDADILIILCDQNASTVNLINKEFLQKMKKSAVLINAARGPIVNTEDLAEALKNGTIYGAGVDVVTGEPNVGPENPLVQAKNCVVLPHMGSADIDTRHAMGTLCVKNAIAGARGEPLVAEAKV